MATNLFESDWEKKQRLAKQAPPGCGGDRCEPALDSLESRVDHALANGMDPAKRIVELERENQRLRDIIAKRKPVRKTDPETSKMAESDNRPRRGSQRFKILEYVYDNGPATCDEWEAALQIPHGPRQTELERMGLLTPAGGTRPTRFGSEARVYKLTDAGRDFIKESKDLTK